MIRPDVFPNAPAHKQPTIGLIGMGAMGRIVTYPALYTFVLIYQGPLAS
jgi:hypothetical protein